MLRNWFAARSQRPHRSIQPNRNQAASRNRRVFLEQLEDRRVLVTDVLHGTERWGEVTDATFTNFNMPSGSDRLLFVMVGLSSESSAPTVASVTYNGQSLTRHFSNTSSNYLNEIWYYPLGDGGAVTSNIAFNTSDGARGVIYAAAITGANQVTPIDDIDIGNVAAGASSSSRTLTSEYGDVAFDVMLFRSTGDFMYANEGANQLTLFQGGVGVEGDEHLNNSVSLEYPASTSATMSWTIPSPGPSQTGRHMAVNVNQAHDPNINVRGNGVNIATGDVTPALSNHTDFGTADVAGGTVTRTFTIQNTAAAGDLPLSLYDSPRVRIYSSGGFTVTDQPAAVVAGGSSTTFDVTFNPFFVGTETATIEIYSDDYDEWPYTFALQGTGFAIDYGDAPDTTAGTGPGNYQTLKANGGPSHVATGPHLGTARDGEADGQPNATASGDGGDEDGVYIYSNPIVSATAARNNSLYVYASGTANLDAWIDFNQDGDWNDTGERIANGLNVTGGYNLVNFIAPAGSLAGDTFGRFRVSTAGVAGPGGSAPDGEVEDRILTLWPELNISDANLTEGTGGSTNLQFTVTRSQTNTASSVNFGTVNGTASSLTGDFTATAGLVNFTANGASSMTVNVSIQGDNIVEATEQFQIALSNAIGATIGDGTGVGTITDNDTATYTIEGVTVNEADGTLIFSVATTNPVDIPVSIDVGYSDLSTLVDDFDHSGDTATFPALSTASQQVTVAITNDLLSEGTETFLAGMAFNSATTAILNGRSVVATDTANGTIVDNDIDLVLTQTESIDPVLAGSGTGNLTYIVTVENIGLTDATNVDISEAITLPAGASVASITPSSGTYTPSTATTGTWNLPSLIVADTATLTVVLTVGPTAADGAIVGNDAIIVSAGEVLVETADDSVSETTTVQARDFGDAPDSYGTLLASSGAYHRLGSGLTLGTTADPEADGVPTALADGDDTDAWGDDEAGVTLSSTLIPNAGATAIVNASAAGKLDAWVDFNRNGTFDPAEQIATSVNVAAGNNNINFLVPGNAAAGVSYARFRLSTAGELQPTGVANDGEVEDYRLTIFTPSPSSAQIVEDPQHPGDDLLLVNGTANSDAIIVQPVPGQPGQVRVVFPGLILGPFAATSIDRIEIFALAGHDSIAVDAAITQPATIHGGAGYDSISSGSGDDLIYGDEDIDSIMGNAGNDVILGGDGADYLYGNLGNDVLIGGTGADWLNGNEGDDLLIGGSTTHDGNFASLHAIALIWKGSGSFESRTAAEATWLSSSTVINDGVADYTYGNAGRDWLIDYALLDYFFDYAAAQDKKN
jgi:hypothetical protein